MDIEQSKHNEMVEINLDPIVVPPDLYDDDEVENDNNLEIVVSDGKDMNIDCVPEDFLKTDIAKGLTQQQIEQRTRKFGKNQLPEEKTNHFKAFLAYFTSPIELVIEFAAILCLGLQDWIDAGIIIAILLLNAFVGFFQEFQAGGVINKLKSTLALHATVIRDGVEIEVLAKDVVPGDIIKICEGDVVPADAKLVGRDAFIQCDQAALTGESLPVSKHEGDPIYSSCPVKRGTTYAIVTATGSHTFLGKSATLVSKASTSSHFRKILDTIAIFLVMVDFIAIFIIFVQGYYRNQSISYILSLTAILTVASVPIALPAVTTTTLVVGSSILAKKKAIVTKLTSIESLAGVDILCSDKTGTLTKNILTVNEPYCLEGSTSTDMLRACAIAGSALHALNDRKKNGKKEKKITAGMEPIDKAIFKSLQKYNVDKESIASLESIDFHPFDPVTKYVYSVVRDPNTGKQTSACKGAVHNVLKMVERENKQQYDHEAVVLYEKSVDEFARRGFRSLGVAMKEGDLKWKLIGILPLFDPPRDDSAETIKKAKSLGVKVKMLTGDQLSIAKETGNQLGMGINMFDAKHLQDANKSGSELADLAEAADGFAGVFPEHKYKVVEILQGRGHLISVSGDGVNDAPALKKADVGIAVEGASEVARSAASMVLLAPGLGVIIDAIQTSRQIFNRMYGFSEYRIAISLQLVIYLVLSQLIFNEIIPVTLVVFLALFSDIAVLMIAYDRTETSSLPMQWNLPMLVFRAFIIALCLLAGNFIIHTIALTSDMFGEHTTNGWQAVVFLEISLTQNWMIISTRTHASAFNSFRPSIWLVITVFCIDILTSCFAGFGWFTDAIGIDAIIYVWLLSIGVFVLSDVLIRGLARWTWLDNILTGNYKSAEREKEMRKWEELMHRMQLLGSHDKKTHD